MIKDAIVIQHDIKGCGFYPELIAQFTSRKKFVPMGIFEKPEDWKKIEPEVFHIKNMDGIAEVSCYKHEGLYDLIIKRARSYSWEELEPKIIALLDMRYARITKVETTAE